MTASVDMIAPLCAALELSGRSREAAAVFERSRSAALCFAIGAHEPELRVVADGGPAALPDRYAGVLDRLAELGAPVRHDLVLRGTDPARHEVHFAAQVQGRWKSAALVEEALCRLGFDRAWSSMAEHALRRGPDLDELQAFSVELVDGKPRATIVVSHHDATVEDVRAALGGSPLAARADELCLALTGSAGPYRAAALVTSHSFVDPSGHEPAFRAIYVPAAYGANDAVTRGRTSAYLASLGLSFDAYERALAACGRWLCHRSVGVREDGKGLSIAIELASEAPAPRHASSSAAVAPPPEEIVRRFEHDVLLADHPFLRRLAREPVHLGRLWLMVANFWEGIVSDFPTRLSRVIANAHDDHVRSVLTKQLNDELGEGDFSRAHKAMFRSFLEAVDQFRLPGSDDVLLAPGRAFGAALEQQLFATDPYEVVGAMMMVEIYGKQVDQFMGSQFRRQDKLDAAALKWLNLHEGLEVDHANDSLTLAQCVPARPDAIAAAWRGAEAVVAASRRYLDAFYRILFA